MKNVILIHGDAETPNSFWFPYLKGHLEKRGYNVWSPHILNFEKETTSVIKEGDFTEETILIGHSAGCAFILHVLEKINVEIKKAILVSGYAYTISEGKKGTIKKYDWKKIKANAKKFIVINSDNDPWGYTDKFGRYLCDRLGGTLIIKHDGHMGSTKFNQPYKEFPFLLQLID